MDDTHNLEKLAWPFFFIIRQAYRFLRSAQAKRRTKQRLKKLLHSKKYNIRRLKTLTYKTYTTNHECRRLLLEIGAERMILADGTEGWRLP